MAQMTAQDTEVLLQEGKKAHSTIGVLIKLKNLHLTEEFIDIFKNKFGFMFRNYNAKAEHITEASKIINYLETMLIPNHENSFDLTKLSPELQLLFFKSINEAYNEFKKKHNLQV